MHEWINALILGIIEGITEFLPISSTGHLILAGQLLGFNDDKGKLFEVCIQSGAIVAVCIEYRRRIMDTFAGCLKPGKAQTFLINLIVAFIPTGIMGLLLGKLVKTYLFTPLVVATTFIVGGLIILWVERRRTRPSISSVDELNWKTALILGCFQTLALIPGTSRAGATIIGGLLSGLTRPAATEFSFFLAIPTLFAATAYDLYKHGGQLQADDLQTFGIGFAAAFISAFLAIRVLIRFVATHTFVAFAWYRIAFGLVVLATAYFGLVEWSA
ncbi:MAG: hypothetical protein RIQ52_1718 [Pseudomonadota bacterium]